MMAKLRYKLLLTLITVLISGCTSGRTNQVYPETLPTLMPTANVDASNVSIVADTLSIEAPTLLPKDFPTMTFTPTSTPSPSPTSTPSPFPTATLTPTPAPTAVYFNDVVQTEAYQWMAYLLEQTPASFDPNGGLYAFTFFTPTRPYKQNGQEVYHILVLVNVDGEHKIYNSYTPLSMKVRLRTYTQWDIVNWLLSPNAYGRSNQFSHAIIGNNHIREGGIGYTRINIDAVNVSEELDPLPIFVLSEGRMVNGDSLTKVNPSIVALPSPAPTKTFSKRTQETTSKTIDSIVSWIKDVIWIVALVLFIVALLVAVSGG